MHVQCDLDFPEKLHIYIHIEDTHRQAHNTQAIAMCVNTHNQCYQELCLCLLVILELSQDVVSSECALSVNSLTRSTERSHRVTRIPPTGLAGVCQVLVCLKYLSSIFIVSINILLVTFFSYCNSN